MCLLNLTNPSKHCTHSQCQQPSVEPNAYNIALEEKKRAPIQSISEMLAENILKKLKNDAGQPAKRPTPVVFSKDSHPNPPCFYETSRPPVPETNYFQRQMLLLLGNQMQMICEASNSLNRTFVQMKYLQNDMKTMKDFFQGNQYTVQITAKSQEKSQAKQTKNAKVFIPVPGSVINKEQLLAQLYGEKKEFKYHLELSTNLDSIFYRERNFNFSVSLYDQDHKKVENSNRIPLSIALYTSENIPKIIETNTIGTSILKGCVENDLCEGSASFEKIQIKEVTSHFRNGWVFFVVYAKMPSIFAKNSQGDDKKPEVDVDFMEIKPMILENVTVKAKKMKGKAQKKEFSVESAEEELVVFSEKE